MIGFCCLVFLNLSVSLFGLSSSQYARLQISETVGTKTVPRVAVSACWLPRYWSKNGLHQGYCGPCMHRVADACLGGLGLAVTDQSLSHQKRISFAHDFLGAPSAEVAHHHHLPVSEPGYVRPFQKHPFVVSVKRIFPALLSHTWLLSVPRLPLFGKSAQNKSWKCERLRQGPCSRHRVHLHSNAEDCDFGILWTYWAVSSSNAIIKWYQTSDKNSSLRCQMPPQGQPACLQYRMSRRHRCPRLSHAKDSKNTRAPKKAERKRKTERGRED